jgi:flavodoxin
MKMSRRALALTVAGTISLAGLAMPANAKDGPNGGDESSSSTTARAQSESSTLTTPSSVRERTSTSAKASEDHESDSESSAPTSSAPAAGTTATTVRKSDEKAKAARGSIEVIDNLIRRLKASNVDPAVRDGFVTRLLEMKALFAAGQLGNPATFKTLSGEVRAVLRMAEKAEEATGSTSSTTPEKDDDDDDDAAKEHKKEKGKAVRAKATEVLQAEIDKVNGSNLPDDVKAKVVAALTEAQQNVANHVDLDDAAKEVHDTLEKQRADKFAKMQTRLANAADRVQAAIDKVAAIPGNEALLADANAKLADARAKLAAATTTAELKAAWQLMRDVRRSLPHVELPEPTTTVATAPSTTVAATPDATAAPAVDTTVAPAG